MTVAEYPEWKSRLAHAKLAVGPSELHGSITGLLCAGWAGSAHEMLAALALDAGAGGGAAAAELAGLLDRAALRIIRQLRAGEVADVLLPDTAVAGQANALVDWCRGCLGGLGLTGVLGEVASEPSIGAVLDNLARIAARRIDADDNDAAALRDIVVFVRAAVAQLYRALAPTGSA